MVSLLRLSDEHLTEQKELANWIFLLAQFCSNLLPDFEFALIKKNETIRELDSESMIGFPFENYCKSKKFVWKHLQLLRKFFRFVWCCKLHDDEQIIFEILTKGQKISEWIYEVIVSPKIWTKYCKDICPVLCHTTGQKSLQFLVHILGETMTS